MPGRAEASHPCTAPFRGVFSLPEMKDPHYSERSTTPGRRSPGRRQWIINNTEPSFVIEQMLAGFETRCLDVSFPLNVDNSNLVLI